MIHAVLIAWAAITVAILLWTVSFSLMTNSEMFSGESLVPASPQWGNYPRAWTHGNLGVFFGNTILLAGFGVVITDLLAATASYVLARFTFPLSRLSLLLFMGGMAIPLELIVVPLMIMFASAHWNNSLLGLGLVYAAISLPFSVFVMVSFFRTLPSEIEDAAVLDGASEWAVFRQVMLPLATPGLITISIINFVDIWNEYLLALMLMRDETRMPVSVGLYTLKGTPMAAQDWTALMAGVVMVVVPTILVYVLLQKRIEKGLTLGAFKG